MAGRIDSPMRDNGKPEEQLVHKIDWTKTIIGIVCAIAVTASTYMGIRYLDHRRTAPPSDCTDSVVYLGCKTDTSYVCEHKSHKMYVNGSVVQCVCTK